RLTLCWINEADVVESSVDDMFKLDIDENLNLDDYIVYVDENMNENVNVDENANENINKNVNVDGNVYENMNDNVNTDDEYEQDNVEDEEFQVAVSKTKAFRAKAKAELHQGEKFTPSPKRMYVGSVDHQYLSPFKSTVKIEELDDDALLNAPVVRSSKRLTLCWINEADVVESSVGKNDNVNVDGNVHEEQTINVNDYTIDDMFKLDIDENLNLD
nr:hypothetical protein [Tanacetum cinerariifolium]